MERRMNAWRTRIGKTISLARGWLGVLLFGGGLLAACDMPVDQELESGSSELTALMRGAEQEKTVNKEDVLLTKIDLPNGGTIGWYEVVPGIIMVEERNKYPNSSTLRKHNSDGIRRSPEELYQRLAPKKALPPALIQAMGRREYYAELSKKYGLSVTPKARVEKQEVSATDKSVALMTNMVLASPSDDDSECPRDWFRENWCIIYPNSDWLERAYFQNATSSWRHDGQNAVVAAACSYRGSVRHIISVRTWWSWKRVWDTPLVADGGVSNAFFYNVNFDFDIESKVFEADGDGHHHCGSGDSWLIW